VDAGRPQPGEIVYLASEVFAAGRIFEIGTRALVLEDRAGELSIELGGDSVSCPAEHLVTRRPRSSRAAAWPQRPAAAPRPAFG
jgi:hypothetical protein